MRRLGRELGVEAMALYRYLPSREDLLDGVVDVVLEEYRAAARRAGWEFTGEQRRDRVEISDDAWTVEVEPYRAEDGLVELVVRARQG